MPFKIFSKKLKILTHLILGKGRVGLREVEGPGGPRQFLAGITTQNGGLPPKRPSLSTECMRLGQGG